jgi:hypothetical protein
MISTACGFAVSDPLPQCLDGPNGAGKASGWSRGRAGFSEGFYKDRPEIIDIRHGRSGDDLLADPSEKTMGVVAVQHGKGVKALRPGLGKGFGRDQRACNLGGAIDTIRIGRKRVNPQRAVKGQRNRGIDSCRHSYATHQVRDKRNAQELADNMGTSLAMLQRNYFHIDGRAAADRLSGSKKDKYPKKIALSW